MGKLSVLTCLLLMSSVQLQGSNAQQRVVGGRRTENLKHPYNVSIRSKVIEADAYYHQCAGVIYTERVVITAAQCIKSLPENGTVMILAGASTRTGGDGYLYVARHWLAHESYDSFMVDYDIGLIWIDGKFDFTTPYIAPIQIYAHRPLDGRLVTVTGWGYTEEYGPSSYYLQEAQVPIVSTKDCKAVYGVADVTERMICAGYLANGGKDPCQGDTGGPLIYDGQLVGLVSWGRGCARPGYPTVYTWVISLKSWIDSKIDTTVFN